VHSSRALAMPDLPSSSPRPYSSDAPITPAPVSGKRGLWLVLGAVGCVVSIFVIGILATLIVPNLVQRGDSLKRTKARADLAEIDAAVRVYHERHDGRWPADLGSVVAEPECHLAERQLRDPWKRPYLYDPAPDPGSRPRIYTLGRDGTPGGRGFDADLDNFQASDE
jgi:general secretion pathway protein G